MKDGDVSLEAGSLLVLLASLVFFTCTAWMDSGRAPSWVVFVRMVAAIVLALAALVALL